MSQLLSSTPKKDSFRMPAEFEPHVGCWMLWPERTDNWRNGSQPARDAFAKVAGAISQFEPVTIGVSGRQYLNARAMLPASVRVVEISSDDAWMRDCGPTFVTKNDGEVRGIDWEFNAWGGLNGGLYASWEQDNLVAQKVLEIERIDRYKAPFVMEGGAIHVDGQGAALVTEECLLNPNRNPHLSRTEIEQALIEYLNVQHIIWLGQGVYLDETDGHIDNLACFIHPGVVALTWTDDKSDPQYEISGDALERLSRAVDAQGRLLEIHKIHQPGPLYITEAERQGLETGEGSHPRMAGQRMAGSYINFYITNGGIIAPTFNDPFDAVALEKLQELFPDRQVVSVPGREILLGGGNIHCITQQQPARK
jgi:agmatine deiminase